jgi:uncharacterized protein involved in exopolysaccharide biosynthesis/Mrp family chromosome partitioning ATPase
MAYEDPHDQLASRASLGAPWSAAPSIGPSPGQQRARDEGVDLAQLWGMVRDNAGLVFVIGAVVFAVVMARCLTSPMTFRSVARMYLGESEGRAPANANLDIGSGSSSEASSEIEVLRSRSMVRRAILASGLNVSIAPPGWQPPLFGRWLLSRRDPKLLDAAATQIAATESSLPDEQVVSRTYRVRFTTTTDYQLLSAGSKPVAAKLGEPAKLDGLSLTLVPGRSGPKAGSEFEVVVQPLDDVVEAALGELRVSIPKGGPASDTVRVLLLEFANPSRRLAASFLEHLMRAYLEARHAWKTEDASAAETFVTGQLRAMQDSLDRTQEKLAEYRADNRVVVLANEAQSMVQQVSKFEEQRVAAVLQISALKDIKLALRAPNTPLEAYMFGEASDTVLQQLAESLSQAREKLSELDGQYGPAAPEIKRQHALVGAQVDAIRNYVDGRLARAEKTLASLDQVIGKLETKLKTVPGAELGLTQIGRESDVYSRMYSYLLERQQQAAITKASTVSKNRILDPPHVSLREDSPKLAVNLASGLLGLLLGAAVVILRGLFSGVFRRDNDVRVVLGPVQVFARVPIRSHKSRVSGGEPTGVPLFDVMAAQSEAPDYTEAFRSLRTNLYHALPGEHGKVVLVTSPGPGDGKTMCALSLAAMLAADNRRVLVIDADIRKPSHHELLGVTQEPGLPDLIMQTNGSRKDAIRTMCLSVGWFDSISAGVGANAELLSESSFSSFLVSARSRYDFIVLDAPSYPFVSDPLVLAPLSDFVLSVVRLGSTSRKLAEEHVAGLFTVARGYAVAVNYVAAAPARLRPSAMPARLSGVAQRQK